jgi:ubiquinone/menaquinone biosynthesis C-methylase UbiE
VNAASFNVGIIMINNKFDPKKLQKLNNPKRLMDIPPDYVRGKLGMEQPGIFVDLGAGTAFFSIAFLKEFKPSTIYACDSSKVMINWMKDNVSPKYPDIVPIKTEEHTVPLPDAIAELVFMINLHHELNTPPLTIKESSRLLKPDGKIIIIDWKKEDMPEGPPVEIRYLPEQVKAQLMDAGFEQVDISNDLRKHFLVVGKKAHPRT